MHLNTGAPCLELSKKGLEVALGAPLGHRVPAVPNAHGVPSPESSTARPGPAGTHPSDVGLCKQLCSPVPAGNHQNLFGTARHILPDTAQTQPGQLQGGMAAGNVTSSSFQS